MTGHPHVSDRKAAYTGLIVGAIAVAIVVLSIIALTNRHFAAEEGAKPAAGSPP